MTTVFFFFKNLICSSGSLTRLFSLSSKTYKFLAPAMPEKGQINGFFLYADELICKTSDFLLIRLVDVVSAVLGEKVAMQRDSSPHKYRTYER